MAQRGIQPSLGQCALRNLGVTERLGVPECGRAPKCQSGEADYRDGAEEWPLTSGLPSTVIQATSLQAGTPQVADLGRLSPSSTRKSGAGVYNRNLLGLETPNRPCARDRNAQSQAGCDGSAAGGQGDRRDWLLFSDGALRSEVPSSQLLWARV